MPSNVANCAGCNSRLYNADYGVSINETRESLRFCMRTMILVRVLRVFSWGLDLNSIARKVLWIGDAPSFFRKWQFHYLLKFTKTPNNHFLTVTETKGTDNCRIYFD